MTQFLPANLLALFTARPPIPFKPPPEKLKRRKNAQHYVGIADFMSDFEVQPPPPATRGETREEREERKRKEKIDLAQQKLEEKIVAWDPHSDPNAAGDPFKTLFIARINFDTTEHKLRRELETYGPIRKIQIVFNTQKRKPRGYAFVEYEHERDMHSAYKHADGKKIDGRRIVVDVERGRTVKSWRPRRLGGGLGGTRRGGPDENIRHSGRVEQWEGRERGERGDRDRERDREERKERRSRSPRDRKERGDRKERSDRDRDRGDRDRDRDRERRRDRDGDRDRDRDRDGERDRDRDGDRDRRRDRERRDRDRDRERSDRDRNREEIRDRPQVKEEEGELPADEERRPDNHEAPIEPSEMKQDYEIKDERYDPSDYNGYSAQEQSS